MNDPRSLSLAHRSWARPAIAVAAMLVLIAACSLPSGGLERVATPPPTGNASPDVPTATASPGSSVAAASPASSTDAPVAGSTVVRAYFFLGSFTGNAGLVPVERVIPKTQAVGAAAMAALLGGPSSAELAARPAMYTDVPDGTRFLGLQIIGGIATVDLSSEFAAGGDTASVAGRTAQVVYTLTQFPTIQGVRFELDGVPPKTVFTGSLGRADETSALPAIFVDRPVWGGTLANPARVTGLTDVFEATFRIAILDRNGTVIADVPAMASCGTGCWGRFDVSVPYHVATTQPGTLQVYDLSAKDGSRADVTEYPVILTPGG